MSFLSVVPDIVGAAAGKLEGIGSALNAANAAAATPTTGLAPMAADEVSAAVTAMFATHAQAYQALSAQAAAFHDQFTRALNAGAGAYVSADIANATLVTGGGGVGTTVTGAVAPLLGPTAPFSAPLVNTNTPLGPISLTLNGTVDLITGEIAFDSGSFALPTPLALGVDAVGPYYVALTALQHSGAAFANAASSGNLLGAASALVHAPGDVVTGFLFGHETISQTVPAPAGLGYRSFGFNVPVGGLLTPLQPVTVTATPTSGTPTVIALSGTQFGGLVPALLHGVIPGY
ncbi:PE family protein [Mycobacterium lacus]|uniref:PE family protein n=1 Tax=Mycobacterium lacus TaxID=169765 RepID=A0A1X1Y954_9MYCO|nr:PE family protein [Mycobacterium lacus]MCV7122386.1 PE family protein [Mycobacterium lacus]ORW07585.1 PE family protein [Mycobacterium lacus]BBX96227.1 PE family protein [Mycobacterium lacus]